jgi:hypothetical protein
MSLPPDALGQLRDIHLPEPISGWPPAPGWWLLGILVLLTTIIAVRWLIAYYQNNAYRRAAQAQLNSLIKDHDARDSCTTYAININLLLKQVAVTSYYKTNVASLSGKQWLEFLDSTGNTKNFTEGPGHYLETAQYQPNVNFDVAALTQCCRQWINEHA